MNFILQIELLSLLARQHDPTTISGLKSWTAAHEPAGKFALMQAALNGLFESVAGLPDPLAKRAAIILQNVCENKLKSFVADNIRTG